MTSLPFHHTCCILFVASTSKAQHVSASRVEAQQEVSSNVCSVSLVARRKRERELEERERVRDQAIERAHAAPKHTHTSTSTQSTLFSCCCRDSSSRDEWQHHNMLVRCGADARDHKRTARASRRDTFCMGHSIQRNKCKMEAYNLQVTRTAVRIAQVASQQLRTQNTHESKRVYTYTPANAFSLDPSKSALDAHKLHELCQPLRQTPSALSSQRDPRPHNELWR